MHFNESMDTRPQILIRDLLKRGQFLAPAIISLLLAAFTLQGMAWSQPQKSPQSDVVAQESGQGNGKVIEFKQLKLEGTVQRPSAAYLMQRRQLKFKGIIPKKSFISKIKKSVSKPPF